MSDYFFTEVERIARSEGVEKIYISTNHKGLYEKYGCEFYKYMKDIDGEESRAYTKTFSLNVLQHWGLERELERR